MLLCLFYEELGQSPRKKGHLVSSEQSRTEQSQEHSWNCELCLADLRACTVQSTNRIHPWPEPSKPRTRDLCPTSREGKSPPASEENWMNERMYFQTGEVMPLKELTKDCIQQEVFRACTALCASLLWKMISMWLVELITFSSLHLFQREGPYVSRPPTHSFTIYSTSNFAI